MVCSSKCQGQWWAIKKGPCEGPSQGQHQEDNELCPCAQLSVPKERRGGTLISGSYMVLDQMDEWCIP